MKAEILKVYFKAGVLVPFYLACFLSFISIGSIWVYADYSFDFVASHPFCYSMAKVAFLSGITGILTLTAFLNVFRSIAYNLFYSLLAWMFLPYCFVVYLLWKQVDWTEMNRPGSLEMIEGVVLLVVCFFHVIGIIISYIDFRATIVLNIKEKEGARLKIISDDKAVIEEGSVI